jgi:hypothetical protein
MVRQDDNSGRRGRTLGAHLPHQVDTRPFFEPEVGNNHIWTEFLYRLNRMILRLCPTNDVKVIKRRNVANNPLA